MVKTISALTGISRHQITFTNLESKIAQDNEIRFIDAFVEGYISPLKGAKECELTGKTYFLKVEEIMRCEADGNYTRIFKNNNENIFTAKTLKEYDDILREHAFIRVHRAHLVNKQFIKSMSSDNKIKLQNDTLVEVSRRKVGEIKNLFNA